MAGPGRLFGDQLVQVDIRVLPILLGSILNPDQDGTDPVGASTGPHQPVGNQVVEACARLLWPPRR